MRSLRWLRRRTSLGDSAISGAFWLTSVRLILRATNFLALLFLARLLAPDDFGLVALGMLVLNLFGLAGSLGCLAAVVQQPKRPKRHDYDVAWTYDSCVKAASAVLLFLSAPLLAAFFREPRMTPIVQFIALHPALQAIEHYTQAYLMRRLDFAKRFVLEVSNAAVTMVVTLILAFVLRNVWAIVIGYVAGTAARTTMSYLILPWLPRVRFDWSVAKQQFGFGRWVVGLSMLRTVREQTDRFVLGGLLGATSLAYFEMASKISRQTTADFYQTAHRVLFPIYARMQSDHERMARNYKVVLHLSALVVLPFCTMIAVSAEPVTVLLFGEKWRPAADAMRLLAMASSLKIVTGTAHPLLRGQGAAGREFTLTAMYFATLLPLSVALTLRWGYLGTAWAVTLAELLQVPLWLWMLNHTIGVTPRSVREVLVVPVLGSVLLAAASAAATGAMATRSLAVQAACGITAGAAAYVGFLALAWSRFKHQGADLTMVRFGAVARRLGLRLRRSDPERGVAPETAAANLSGGRS